MSIQLHPLGHFPCSACKARGHPLDLIANTSKEEIAAFEAERKRIAAMPYVDLAGHSLPNDNRAGMGKS